MRLEGAGSKASDGGEDFGGGFLPARRFGVFVVQLDKVLDGVNERADAGMAAALDLALG